MQDVIVIGGSYAGMAAALQLARARRTVLVTDAGQRRNRFASHSHGFLGQDGVDPAEIHAGAKRQLLAYPTLCWVEVTAAAITGQKDDFRIATEGGDTFAGRRILLATGVIDRLPGIPGLAERWGGRCSIAPIAMAMNWIGAGSGSSPPGRCRSIRRSFCRNGARSPS